MKTWLYVLAFTGVSVGAYLATAQNARLRDQLKLSRQNVAALSDTLRIVENERGEIESSRALLVGSLEDVARTNDSLAQRLRRLQGDLDIALAASVEVVSRDTITTGVERIDSLESRFTYDPPLPAGNRLLVEGLARCEPDSVEILITGYRIIADLAIGIREREGGIKEAVITSNWPGLVADVEGVILEPEIIIGGGSSWVKPAAIGLGAGAMIGVVVGLVLR